MGCEAQSTAGLVARRAFATKHEHQNPQMSAALELVQTFLKQQARDSLRNRRVWQVRAARCRRGAVCPEYPVFYKNNSL